MPTAGIRLTIQRNGQEILSGDSAWLHMRAIAAAIDQDAKLASVESDYPPILFFAETSPAGELSVWIQPVIIPDPP